MEKMKKSLSTEVYLELKKRILNNEILPGERLVEMTIANELEVSRTPVREALRDLEGEQLVVNFPRKGYVVSKISISQSKDLYEVRRALEPMAMEHLANTAKPEDVAKLTSVVNQLREALLIKDFPMVELLMVEWNRKVISLLQNTVMQEMMTTINNRLYRLANYIFGNPENFHIIYDHIMKMYEAILGHKGEEAHDLSRNLVDLLVDILENQTDHRMFRK